MSNEIKRSTDAIMNRILSQLGYADVLDKLLSLPKSDFNTLLLNIFNKQTENITPIDVVKAFQTNRFSVPSEIDPVIYHNFEAELLSLAQENGIKATLLSPVAPFASCSAFGCVDQNNVVSAVRGTEILSDPTNMLAIIIAKQIKEKKTEGNTNLHYCTTSRVLRSQVFPALRGYYSHFGIFCIVSSGKDSGSYSCEKDLLLKQLVFYKKLLIEKYNEKLSIVLRKRRGYTDSDGFYESMAGMVKQQFPGVPLTLDPDYEENNYYKGMHFSVYMEKDNESVEIGDGGFVDWMQQMTGNKKERCVISGFGLDRMLI